jgi:hypothetical protein
MHQSSMVEHTQSRWSGAAPKVLALIATALVGWFFGAYVGSMFSAPVEVPPGATSIPVAASPVVSPVSSPGTGETIASPPGEPSTSPPAVPTISVLLPTVAPTAPPTPTPPPGRGTSLEGIGFAVQLVDYELRPPDHPEKAAVKYTLRFVNTSPQTVRAEMNLADIKGMDNLGAAYEDYYVAANRFAAERCGLAPNAPKFQENITIQLPAEGVKQFDFYLSRSGAEGSCQEQGTARSRVDSRVDSSAQLVDIQIGRIAYTGDRPRELPSAWWRLSR